MQDEDGRRGRWMTLGAAGAMHFLHDGYSTLIYLLLPVWQMQFGLSLAQAGLLKTLFSGAQAVLQVPAGMLAERAEHRLAEYEPCESAC